MNDEPRRDIVVIGASAGGVEALKAVVADFPADLPAAVFVVLHLAPESQSALPRILSRAGPLPAHHPDHGEHPVPATVVIAPPDWHLEISADDRVCVTHGPRENGYRPAIDRLFGTAAARFGPRVVGVILSGALDDGSAGLAAVAEAGGAAVVQDPGEALYPAMPQNALAVVPDAEVLPLHAIGARITELVTHAPHDPGAGVGGGRGHVVTLEQAPNAGSPHHAQPGRVSGFTCPECRGALWEAEEGGVLRFRCRVGHAYSSESFVAEQGTALEAALWSALRALEERAALFERLARRMDRNHRSSARYRRESEEAKSQARLVQAAIDQLRPVAESA
jgi:two-component system chemotaxis response regulator CheB